MKKVFMVHGFQGEPNGGWRPWLMGELAKRDIYACALPMPTPYEPKKNEWVELISKSVGIPDGNIYLVGHSLGSAAILLYLESLSEKDCIGGVVLVSGPSRILNPENKESKLRKIDNFLDTPFDFDYIKQKSKSFAVIHGSNDTKVPPEHAKFIADSLGCNLVTIQNGGHLGGSDGWRELPPLLEILIEMLK